MATLLSRLFPSRTATVRKAAKAPTPAKSRLGLEALDPRELPSVTSALNNGVLTITADGYKTNAWVSQGAGTIVVAGLANSQSAEYSSSAVNRIVYNGGPDANQYYAFRDMTSLPTSFNVGPGYGSVYGGSGTNTFNAGATNHASLYAGTGANVLNRNGTAAALQDVAGVTSGPKEAFGLISGTPTTDELAATGTLMASLAGRTVTINGPSGIGFQLVGDWTDTRNSATGAHAFSAVGAVTLHTGSDLGDITVRSGQTIKITTKASAVDAPGGEFDAISWAGIPLSSTDATSPFHQMSSQYGLSVSGAGTSWGIKLGGDLSSMGVPLNPAVPYLYYRSTTGDGLTFGQVNAKASNGGSFSLAVDPADPSAIVKYGDYGFGVSLKGEIPYTPTQLPDLVADPKIYGNLYATGSVNLGDLPASLSGSVVIDLDANQDGHLAGITSQTLSNVLNGTTSLKDAFSTALNDIKVGVNGELDFSLDQYGISLSAPLGQASAFFTPKEGTTPALMAFRGQSVNPFKGTVLEKFSPLSTFDFQGWVNGDNHWAFKAASGTGTYFGFQGNSLEFDANSATSTVHAHASLGAMLGLAEISLDGTVNWSTGDFDLTQTATVSLDAKLCDFSLTETFDLSYHNGAFSMDVGLTGYGQLGTDNYNVHAGFTGDLSITVDSSGSVTFDGSGSGTVGYTFAGKPHDTTLASFDINNDGFEFSMLGHGVKVDW
jgi:hypothetical protein